MALDKDCPCNTECKRRPNCKGCEEGNAWRKKKQAEAEQRYKNNAFHRHEIDLFNSKLNKSIKNQKRTKRWKND